MSTTTRFAPSPTGQLHLGNVRAALFNWLVARHDGGRFLLRIEDTDTAREVAGGTEAIIDDLGWLGLVSDEAPWFQSKRAGIYGDELDKLAKGEYLYPCFCTDAELKAQREKQAAASKPPRYDGTCAGIAAADAAGRVAAGEAHTLRFRVPPHRKISFSDRVHGRYAFATRDIGDFVIRRSDGSSAFFFTNAVDDALAGVTLVLRGDDHLSNTPRQLLILEALGLDAPEYGHLPLFHDSDGEKMSKRNDGTGMTLATLRHLGYHPLAIANYLARVGGQVDSQEALPMDALAAAFSTMHFGRSSARFDDAQLKHWQRKTLDILDTDALWAWMDSPVHARVPDSDREAFIALVRPNTMFPGEVLDWCFVLYDDNPMPQKAAITLLQENASPLFTVALSAYEEGLPWSDWLARIKSGANLKGPALFKPLRAALTGRLDGPELAEVYRMLSPKRIRDRLETASTLARA